MSHRVPSLAEWGENNLISMLTRDWPRGTATVPVGVGDDCAVLAGHKRNHFLLLKTDAIVEDVHFLPNVPHELIGRKALARVVSDFAAMAATPTAALVTLGLPRDTPVARLKGIYRGLEKLAKQYDVQLVGGETTRAQELFLSIAALGECHGYAPVLRSTALPGHLIYTTGQLGGTQKRHHLTFTPRLTEALWLVKRCRPSSMMDLSDGLGADLPRLATASNVSYTLNEACIPRRRGATVQQALNDGEDFELLFTIPPTQQARLHKNWPFETRITCIGTITPPSAIPEPARFGTSHGFDHFRQR